MQLNVKNVTCARGERIILRNMSFSLNSGEGLLLQGSNGSGKTTLLRCIAGFMTAIEGEINLASASENIESEDIEIGEYCHYIGHLNGIKSQFTVYENLVFFKDYFASSPQMRAHIPKQFLDNENLDGKNNDLEDALNVFNLRDLRDIPAGALSAGQKRRLCLLRLCLVKRPIWLLDEPTVALDQTSQELLVKIIQNHITLGGLVIVATHISLPGLSLQKHLVLNQSISDETLYDNHQSFEQSGA